MEVAYHHLRIVREGFLLLRSDDVGRVDRHLCLLSFNVGSEVCWLHHDEVVDRVLRDDVRHMLRLLRRACSGNMPLLKLNWGLLIDGSALLECVVWSSQVFYFDVIVAREHIAVSLLLALVVEVDGATGFGHCWLLLLTQAHCVLCFGWLDLLTLRHKNWLNFLCWLLLTLFWSGSLL